jgi:misacylated tRNA(Ala) deacylase
MSTQPLFQQDSYLTQCEAKIIRVCDDGVVLDQTVFYPLGGGQPGDSGILKTEQGLMVQVMDTRKSKQQPGEIVHIVNEELENLSVGDRVTAEINWDKRYRYMRMHTCMHVFCSILEFPVTGGNISLDKCRLDFDMPEKPDKQQLTDQLNQLISRNTELGTRWISDEEMQANMDLVKTMSVKPPMGAGKVRLVEIPGIDLQPCGGTHVKNTSEIGEVRVKKIENKGKQNKRVIIELVE